MWAGEGGRMGLKDTRKAGSCQDRRRAERHGTSKRGGERSMRWGSRKVEERNGTERRAGKRKEKEKGSRRVVRGRARAGRPGSRSPASRSDRPGRDWSDTTSSLSLAVPCLPAPRVKKLCGPGKVEGWDSKTRARQDRAKTGGAQSGTAQASGAGRGACGGAHGKLKNGTERRGGRGRERKRKKGVGE